MAVATTTPTGRRSAVHAPYRLSIEMAGLLIVLLGAWGGIVPYVGPLFGFSGDGSGAWRWTFSHALLNLAPGAVALAFGLLIMVACRSLAGRPVLALAGLVVAVCGAWFIIGPLAWPVMRSGAAYFVGARPLRELAFWIGYSLGPGSLLIGLGAFAIGRPAPSDRVEARGVSPGPSFPRSAAGDRAG
jgi:hypothetical protein